MDVQADPARLDELRRLGVPLVPAVAVGDRAAHGWNPEAYAALLGVAYRPPDRLPPRELAARLDAILAAAQALVERFEPGHLDVVPPERERSVRDLAWHVFRLAQAFPDAMERGELPEGWLGEGAPPGAADGRAVARYGAAVRARLAGWFAGAGEAEFARVVAVYTGPQTGWALLERTAWHAAQHLRQLYALAGRMGVEPPQPLPTGAFAGLPLPDALW